MAGNKIEAASRHSISFDCFELAIRSAPHAWWQKVINGDVPSIARMDIEVTSLHGLNNDDTESVVGKEIGVKSLHIADDEVGARPLAPVDASLDVRTFQFKHWQLGETDMTRRAGRVIFSSALEEASRNLPFQSHAQSQPPDGRSWDLWIRPIQPPYVVVGSSQPYSVASDPTSSFGIPPRHPPRHPLLHPSPSLMTAPSLTSPQQLRPQQQKQPPSRPLPAGKTFKRGLTLQPIQYQLSFEGHEPLPRIADLFNVQNTLGEVSLQHGNPQQRPFQY